MRDTEDDERARRLAITSAGGFGAYIGVPVHLPDGRPFGTLCCLSHSAKPELGDRDVAVLERLRDGFLSAISHELRTPLTAILGTVATLRDRSVPPELSDRLMERLGVNAERLDRLLADLLDLNEFTYGMGRVRRERVRLDELVRTALDGIEGPDPVLDLEPVEAEVAPAKFERIVLSLVTNAVVHGQDRAPADIRLRPSEGGALLVVSDRGAGVDPEDQQAVFEPFWQGGTAPAHSPGVGIGLSLVAAFTELHGGRAWVEDAPDGGAAFHVWLPGRSSDPT